MTAGKRWELEKMVNNFETIQNVPSDKIKEIWEIANIQQVGAIWNQLKEECEKLDSKIIKKVYNKWNGQMGNQTK